ncbi:hypothetical protein I4U23_021625 [Adineta vaga]|nr:hypothetical protein I4U23_021625 [Adineta vaga]
MSNSKSVEELKETWDQINGENMDEFLKELGIGMAKRMAVKSIKSRLVYQRKCCYSLSLYLYFTEYFQTTVRINGNALEHTMRGKNGKECVAVRYVNDQD